MEQGKGPSVAVSSVDAQLFLTSLRLTQIPLTEEEIEQQKPAPEKMALGGDGGFSLGGPPKHRVDKQLALVILPGGIRVPLPCPELPEIVLQVIEAITVSEPHRRPRAHHLHTSLNRTGWDQRKSRHAHRVKLRHVTSVVAVTLCPH